MKSLVALAFGLILGLFASRARADTTTCGEGSFATTGQYQIEVFHHCGRPSWSDTYYERYRRAGTVRVDQWVYEVGYGYFPRMLIFRNGVLSQIVELSHFDE